MTTSYMQPLTLEVTDGRGIDRTVKGGMYCFSLPGDQEALDWFESRKNVFGHKTFWVTKRTNKWVEGVYFDPGKSGLFVDVCHPAYRIDSSPIGFTLGSGIVGKYSARLRYRNIAGGPVRIAAVDVMRVPRTFFKSTSFQEYFRWTNAYGKSVVRVLEQFGGWVDVYYYDFGGRDPIFDGYSVIEEKEYLGLAYVGHKTDPDEVYWPATVRIKRFDLDDPAQEEMYIDDISKRNDYGRRVTKTVYTEDARVRHLMYFDPGRSLTIAEVELYRGGKWKQVWTNASCDRFAVDRARERAHSMVDTPGYRVFVGDISVATENAVENYTDSLITFMNKALDETVVHPNVNDKEKTVEKRPFVNESEVYEPMDRGVSGELKLEFDWKISAWMGPEDFSEFSKQIEKLVEANGEGILKEMGYSDDEIERMRSK